MKSIKDQYIDLKEGRMSQFNFMRNLRMTLPQFISNVTPFNSAVKILQNKGILTEIKINESFNLEDIILKYVKDPDDAQRELDAYQTNGFDGFSDALKAQLSRDDDFRSLTQMNHDEEQFDREGGQEDFGWDSDDENLIDRGFVDDFNDGEFWENQESEDHIQGSLASKEKELELEPEEEDYPDFHDNISEITSNTSKLFNKIYRTSAKDLVKSIKKLTDDELKSLSKHDFSKSGGPQKIQGALIGREMKNRNLVNEIKNRITAAQAQPQELNMGRKVEMEHTDNPETAERIALDHLTEDPFYYTKLHLAGLADEINNTKPKKSNKKRTDLPTLVGKDNFVDKANQMKTPKGVVKVKASANKAKKETNKGTGKITLMSLVAIKPRGVEKMAATGEKMKKIVVKENQKKSQINEDHIQDRVDAINLFAKLVKSKNYDDIFSEYENITNFPDESNITPKEANQILKKYFNNDDWDKFEEYTNQDFTDPAGGSGLNSHMEEADLNLFPNEKANQVVQQAQQFIESNPTLNQISDSITLQNSGDDTCILKYEYWENLPKEAVEKLSLQFNVEKDIDSGDEEKLPMISYLLTSKGKPNRGLGVNTLKEIIRQELKEYFDGRDNLTAGDDEDVNGDGNIMEDNNIDKLKEYYKFLLNIGGGDLAGEFKQMLSSYNQYNNFEEFIQSEIEILGEDDPETANLIKDKYL